MSRKGGRNWRPPPRRRSSRRNRKRGRGVGNEGSANAVAEEAASVDADSPQLPPEPPLPEQTAPSPRSLIVGSGDRYSLSAVGAAISSAVEKVRRVLGLGSYDEELDEKLAQEIELEHQLTDALDENLDDQDEAFERGDLDEVERLKAEYEVLKERLREIQGQEIK